MSAAQSPVVLSSYDPKGRFLCYVSTALDKQRVSVEPTQKLATDSVLNENFLSLNDSNLRCLALEWTYLSANETVCVLLALNNGEVWLYSPLANEVLYKLSTGNSSEVRDMSVHGSSLWCIDSQDFVYEFDLTSFELKQHFQIESCSNLQKILVLSSTQLLLASHQIFLVDISTRQNLLTFPGHVSPVTVLEKLTSDYFISGADSDRFLNVYDLNSSATKTVLVAQSNVVKLSHYDQDCIVITTEDGTVEIFVDPLITNTNKRRTMKSKQATKTLKAIGDSNDSQIPLLNAFVHKDILTLSYLQNATIPFFNQLQWRDLPVEFTVKLTLNQGITHRPKDRSLHGQDLASVANYKEGNARVTSGDNFKHIEDIIRDLELEEKAGERANEDAVFESLSDRLPTINTTKRKSPAIGTVTVILSQALQSNDHSLLETVLNNRDERVIRDTIMRLRPTLSVILLERLAERIARQTQRQGALNVWVKWCLIVHGGYMVSIPNLLKTLASLHSTMKNRANLLNRLLVLETRLDLTLNSMKLENFEADDEDASATYQEEDEETVEYNEELDDADLIEDGEGDDSESEEEEDEDEEGDDPSAQKRENGDQEVAEDSEGYSDVEMA
ncbi:Utp5p KNAG_0B03930 [Huiozyma naganishii CBS 8797]|uniref:Small-subunit processome Utp12 domain-containing protein n=1 Tax=Huiozyma naganishii (strain ATCC MYA-139 / BCRC 22969 / CBS 8797 / KCTC 17520 / NBRC 10181 / NCYC 3082 / Yp74L-3) TaxID=1071383 RepID=J7S3P4_HUIN7|nr:hypothetical protein KNAG_0B03930 [Kazachstania naganishii CBS 8797]CCK68834.1 hypothetical protein KNAG_0B03930 [Kazachstania naganishii CBS 8797]